MTTILVVDDSAIERKLAARLIAQHVECELLPVANGREALEQLRRLGRTVDLVVSDLRMPVLDGMELLRRIRQQYADVPVVIMTSQGSEDVAVRALQSGAAGYVPKRRLRKELGEVVQSVLSANRQSCDHARAIERIAENRFTIELGNEGTEMRGVIRYLQRVAAEFGFCDDGNRARLGVALEEALTNAMVHGNLEVGSELRERDDDAFARLVQKRRRREPYRSRRIIVECELTRADATFRIRDEGPGFEPSKIPDPTDPQHMSKPSGRGLLLMKAFMDRVEFNALGNEVSMSLCRATSPVESDEGMSAATLSQGAESAAAGW
ncbi:MAG: response regulator [Planctomycetaceae bacterium]